MNRQIVTIGDSLGITLPKLILESFNIKLGDKGQIKVVEGGFFLTFIKKENKTNGEHS